MFFLHVVDKCFNMMILFLCHRRLLDTDPQKRLGSTRDADELMHHQWFESVDWARTARVGALILAQQRCPECRR